MSNESNFKRDFFNGFAESNVFARNANGDFFIGVDGGGPKAVAKICRRNTSVISTGYCAGYANPKRVGEKRAVDTVIGAIINTIAASGWTPDLDEIAGIVVGMPEIENRAMLKSVLRQWSEDPLFGKVPVRFCTDMQIATYGVAVEGPALVTAIEREWEFGRSAKGREYRNSVSESFSKLALNVINDVCKSGRGLALPTTLGKRLLIHFHELDFSGLAYKCNSLTPDELARTFDEILPIVIEEASRGDLIAIEFLLDTAEFWAELTNSTIKQLGIEQQAIPIGVLGKTLNVDDLLRPYLFSVRNFAPKAFIATDMLEPSEAAVRMAIQTFGPDSIN